MCLGHYPTLTIFPPTLSFPHLRRISRQKGEVFEFALRLVGGATRQSIFKLAAALLCRRFLFLRK
jgi:hypothetical protein